MEARTPIILNNITLWQNIMAKQCGKCRNSINDIALECYFCGNTDFEFSFKNKVIQKENLSNTANKVSNPEIYSKPFKVLKTLKG